MLRKFILRDLIGTLVLLGGCVIAGLVLHALRPGPAPQQNVGISPVLAPPAEVSLDEMRKIVTGHNALILDARAPADYRQGHIPSALNLPREDFQKQYSLLQPTLQAHRDQTIVVYCTMLRCTDSQYVAEELEKLGYSDVRVFRGGWFDWQNARLPEETR